MVIMMIGNPKNHKVTNRKASDAGGGNGTGPAGSDESAENGEDTDGGEPAAAGKRSGRARQGPLVEETVVGKTMGTALIAAWEALSWCKVI